MDRETKEWPVRQEGMLEGRRDTATGKDLNILVKSLCGMRSHWSFQRRGGVWLRFNFFWKLGWKQENGCFAIRQERTEREQERERTNLWSGRDKVGAFCFYSGKGKDRSGRHCMSRPSMTTWLGRWLISHRGLPWPLYWKAPQPAHTHNSMPLFHLIFFIALTAVGHTSNILKHTFNHILLNYSVFLDYKSCESRNLQLFCSLLLYHCKNLLNTC